jgi:hypothetical protein
MPFQYKLKIRSLNEQMKGVYMTISIKKLLTLNLQLFAEGGDGGTGAEGTAGSGVATTPKGVKSNPLADVKYGIQEDGVQNANAQVTDEGAVDLSAEFEELIKGKYKDLYDARVSDTVQKRLKGTKEQVAKLESLTPVLEMLGKKYGVDATDAEALIKAVEEDDSYFEEEALELGVPVEQLKQFKKTERENAELRRQMEEISTKENAAKIYQGWLDQAEEAKNFFPSLDLETEMQNPEFVNLLRNNVSVKAAYQVIHQDEIMRGAMQYTAKTIENKLTNNIIANGQRPTENGNSSQSASVIKSDVSQLTKADRQEIIRRVARGEKIKF